jgi:ribosome-binding factor A
VSNRAQQVNSLIRNEFSQILLKEIDLPENALVTLTRVETSSNLIQAKIFISVIPNDESEKILKILNKKIYDLQQKLNKRLKMRPVPKIIFQKEEKTEQAEKIETLLEKLKKEETIEKKKKIR